MGYLVAGREKVFLLWKGVFLESEEICCNSLAF